MNNRGTDSKASGNRTQAQSEVWDFLDHPSGHRMNAPAPPVDAPVQQSSFDSMLLEYWDQPNEMQLNIRLPAAAKNMIERLARRKTVGVSTLVRMWVIESLRREARQL